ncbi:predicted protein [Candida tropicalis MYA-3404]|uniref:BOD1/SHG1 domain-containing protein n=1 Tax=Candida tropicalis (strain ATCC MYA-3404 / T1) TaxID=294747 RepID=C5MDG5_CANTT|nr:predicted protein [Candida tropicalis MYA-3404]EER32595.1 predicted protein [Candida tropicalis MYA-3404]KAG4406220.1 hypothetical protein JTP64_005091 [Candida tropicalis]
MSQQSRSNKSEITDSKQLINIYKKKGKFDNQRKKLLDNFKQSQTYTNLLLKLKLLIEAKVKQDPSILMKNKGKMAALIQGEITTNDNNELLSIVDKDIQDKILDSYEFHNLIKTELIDIKQEISGDNDEELSNLKKQEQLKLERLKLESKLTNLKVIQQHHDSNPESRDGSYGKNNKINYNNNMKSNSMNSNHRINKPSRFNYRSENNSNNNASSSSTSHKEDESNKRKKKDKIPFMMY